MSPRASIAFMPVLSALLGLALSTVVVLAAMWVMTNASTDTWAALVIAPVLLALTFPVARYVAAKEGDAKLVVIIMLAVVFKLIAALVRYFVAFEVYEGSADAAVYIREGTLYAEQIRNGNFAYDGGGGGSSGTHFIRQLTGIVFAITGPTGIGGFLVFAWMGFWGQYLFYRAFRIGVPQGLHRRYATLVFFLPSLLFWPSSIGKEAWMLLTLGLGAYGVARLLARRPGGYLLLAAGLLGSVAVRPHMTVLLVAGLTLGFVLRRSSKASSFSFVGKLIGGGLVAIALVFSIQAAEERFDVEGEGLSGAEQVIDSTAEQTSKGGSEFETRRPTTLTDIPFAVFTVLFRPLPHEAHNAQALLTSMEGVFLIVIFLVSWRRIGTVIRECWRSPYVAFACSYSLLFMIAFSSFGNFGILARQRAQLFPLLLVILALPTVYDLDSRGTVRRQTIVRAP